MKNKMSKKTFIKRKAIKKRKGIKKRKTLRNYRKYKKGGAMPLTQSNVVAPHVVPTNVGSTLNSTQAVASTPLENMTSHDLKSLQNLLNDHASKGSLNASNPAVMEQLTNTYNAYNGKPKSFFENLVGRIMPN